VIKHLIIAMSFALGAGVGLVAYVSVNPRALTHPVAELPLVAVGRPMTDSPVVVEIPSNAIMLSEIRITATGTRAKKQGVLEPAWLRAPSK
jgi:hypothetical protein